MSIERDTYAPRKAKELLKRLAGQNHLKQMSSINKHLGIEDWPPSYHPNRLESPEIFASKQRFNSATLKYQRRFGC